MSAPENKQVHVGVFQLGHTNVDLIAWHGESGGEFYLCPDETSLPRIRVGVDYSNWDQCVSVLLHETMEMALCLHNLRFLHSGKLNGDCADYLFVFDHCQFGDICSEVSIFITQALPKLSVEFKKSQSRK